MTNYFGCIVKSKQHTISIIVRAEQDDVLKRRIDIMVDKKYKNIAKDVITKEIVERICKRVNIYFDSLN